MAQVLFLKISAVFLLMIPGYLAIRKQWISDTALKDFSKVMVYFIYPSLIFTSITQKYTWGGIVASWQLPVAMFLITMAGFVIGLLMCRFMGFKDLPQKNSFLYQLTFNNYSFLPLAIIVAAYDHALIAGLVFSSLGAEIAVWSLGINLFKNQKAGIDRGSLKNLLSPPLIALYAALFALLVLHLLHLQPKAVFIDNPAGYYFYSVLETLGMATVPVSMLVAGGRMAKVKWMRLKSGLVWLVTVFRLVVVPVVAILILKLLFGDNPYMFVMYIVAVMPVSINSMLLSELYGGDQHLVNGTVLTTHLLSLITVPIWLGFLG